MFVIFYLELNFINMDHIAVSSLVDGGIRCFLTVTVVEYRY